ncbi:MAG: hypothetical protein ACRDPR_03775, partial [Nocardioidaceae bacterium]
FRLPATQLGKKESVMKKPAVIILVLFLGFYLLRDPAELAVFAQNAGVALWKMVSTLFVAIIEFLNTLLG